MALIYKLKKIMISIFFYKQLLSKKIIANIFIFKVMGIIYKIKKIMAEICTYKLNKVMEFIHITLS